ncbi:MAG: nitronate monooxygenase family protein [Clostridia bacterium]|nr:nitronate monooxygenase family protein [Clostridia bacterium]
MNPLVIGNKTAAIPIIQGGMGVGVSMGKLSGAVAKEGGIGIISTAQIGFYMADFPHNPKECNLKAIEEQLLLARQLSGGNGLVGANIMVALADYHAHVRQAVACGADVIISGAGLPLDLPALTAGSDVKIAPIVSSLRAAQVIIKKWLRSDHRLPDFVVIEGPKAGGHLGFKPEQLPDIPDYDEEIRRIIDFVNETAEENGTAIPVIVAGGIWDRQDIEHAFSLGASGVQMASRFVCTHECDAADAYKQAYISAADGDLRIIKSPVGMPGRAISNRFLQQLETETFRPKKCLGCLAGCKPNEIPYCITERLIMAVQGDVDNGLLFCGANAGRIDRIVSVHELMQELASS